tara:strand:+ start:5552 stop:7291 length:1740 start_codon:yes stop_codon:yes gene_type:complete
MSESTGFFVADNKIPLKESYVAIPSQNGLSYSAQKLIEFYIPPNIDAFKPKNSYLQFDLEISQDSNASTTRLQLDELIGGQVLLDTVRIHSGDKSELLEEIRHYPVHVATKYAYHSNPTLKDLRALNEGAGIWTPDARGTRGSSKSALSNHKFSPYYENVSADPTSASFTNSKYHKCKLKLPLHTGLFQNDKVVPVGLMNGLFVTILTSENKRVFRQLDSVSYSRRLPLNPLFHSLDGSTGAPLTWANGSLSNKIFVKHDNNNYQVDNFPLCVGEEVGIAKMTSRTENTLSAPAIIKTIETSGTGANKYVKVTFNASVTNSGDPITSTGNFSLFSKSVLRTTSYSPSYEISNAELVLNKIDMGDQARAEAMRDMRDGKMMVYDFLSTQVYNHSQLKGDRVANIGIPGNHQRAKSIICVPTDASVYSTRDSISGSGTYEIHANSHDSKLLSSQSGIAGISDRLTEYFFFYDGRNQPSLNVKTERIGAKTSIDAIPILELDKALAQADMPALEMSRFQDNFCIGRSMSLNKGVYDMRSKDFRLNVLYQDTTNAPDKDKLWCNFVYHIRRINIRADSIQVEV